MHIKKEFSRISFYALIIVLLREKIDVDKFNNKY